MVALLLLSWIIVGAAYLLAFAAGQGFIGLVAYAAAWVFLLPIMAITSGVLGFLSYLADRRDEKAAAAREKAKLKRATLARRSIAPPPKDPEERYLWANRLPPYDQDNT